MVKTLLRQIGVAGPPDCACFSVWMYGRSEDQHLYVHDNQPRQVLDRVSWFRSSEAIDSKGFAGRRLTAPVRVYVFGGQADACGRILHAALYIAILRTISWTR